MQHIVLVTFRKITFCVLAFFVLASCGEDDFPTNSATPVVSFSVSIQDVLVDQAVTFKNESARDYTTMFWDFGDGTTSTLQSPSHTYSKLGDYTVVLTAKSGTLENKISKAVVVSLSNEISGRKTLEENLGGLSDKILVCAHRATEINTPENSLAGIQKSIDNGIEIIEIDVRLTKDGQLVLMHDASINRTTNGIGNVSNYTLQEIKQFNLYRDDRTLTNERVPTLKEVFEVARGKVYINLDLNEKASFNKVFPLIKQYGMVNQVMVYTKDDNIIRSVLSTNSNLVVLPYIDNATEFNAYSNTNLNIVHYSDTSFNSTLIQAAKDKRWSVYANVYVNTNATPQSDSNKLLNSFISLKGNVIQTDFPEYIKKYLQQRNLN